MEGQKQKIFNISAGQPFAKTLAQHLLRETKDQREHLARYKILLPTRRACRVLREAFLALNDGEPILLPQMLPLGDVDEEELSLLVFENSGAFLEVPPAMPPVQRQMLLASLIAKRGDFNQGYDQALALAGELGQFMDQVIIEECSFDNLSRIVPEHFSDHWQITLKFLEIITQNWPAILAERGMIDAAKRRIVLLDGLGTFWQDTKPDMPIIAAGTTGSVPATARLLRVVSSLPQGRVVLPGVDMEMDEESWGYVEETHPQYGLKKLIEFLGVKRRDIASLDLQQRHSRSILAAEMMRPAQTTHHWRRFGQEKPLHDMLQGLEYYPCRTQQEEAQVIALIMRETLNQPQKRVTLITPDRTLARRVSALCARWGIELDDSAGTPLSDSAHGKFAFLCLKAAASGFDPVSLLALLKSPLCTLRKKNALSVLEKRLLRQDHIIAGLEEMLQLAEEEKLHPAKDLITAFALSLKPLREMTGIQPFANILVAHLQVMENLAGADTLWTEEAGEEAAAFFTALQEHAEGMPAVTLSQYQDILEVMIQGVVVRPSYNAHPRLNILGQIEARLIDADILILAGLNEGSWPSDVKHDPWLSRPMRKDFGLPAAERFTGLAAHDFVQGFCASHVVLTRAERVDGTPTVSSRWLQRLDAVLQGGGLKISDLSQGAYLDWARKMDKNPQLLQYKRPAPVPPVSVRPKGISITRVEEWMKDPYAIYGREVLNLKALRPLVQQNDAALKGSVLHEILEEFLKAWPLDWPEDAEGELIALGKDMLRARLQNAESLRYWWPRFLKIAQWYNPHEQQWRERAKFMATEVEGNVDLDIDGQAFNLHGRADRIDRAQGGYAVIDYKSAGEFSAGQIKSAERPQLPLTALMLEKGAFDGRGLPGRPVKQDATRIPPGGTVYMGYWKLTGGREPGEEISIKEDIEGVIAAAAEGLYTLVRAFRREEAPFYSMPDLSNRPRYTDYAHLARLKEWADVDDEPEEAA